MCDNQNNNARVGGGPGEGLNAPDEPVPPAPEHHVPPAAQAAQPAADATGATGAPVPAQVQPPAGQPNEWLRLRPFRILLESNETTPVGLIV